MNDAIVRNLHKLPPDVDLVIGNPRSGLLSATLLCLVLNVPLADVDGFLAGRTLSKGISAKSKKIIKEFQDIRTVVVIDDSVRSGLSMQRVRDLLENGRKDIKFIFCAVYGVSHESPHIDFIFEKVPVPRMFQWNVMHHEELKNCCMDIDGILCVDPTSDQDDDGERYRKFLAEALPLHRTSVAIGALVTGRSEKYRGQTEQWLCEQGIQYNALHMLGSDNGKKYNNSAAHSQFKADVYAKSNAVLFIESDFRQAHEIAKKSGKPVLCMESNHIVYPSMNMAMIRQLPRRLRVSGSHNLRHMIYALVGDQGYKKIKGFVKGLKPTRQDF
ncbi:MAG TPA: phosphoribosyltransferase [Rhodospirillaceae bacterium]|nr:phosphoribosyltransferase [Rhodospirillaceae bacterium]